MCTKIAIAKRGLAHKKLYGASVNLNMPSSEMIQLNYTYIWSRVIVRSFSKNNYDVARAQIRWNAHALSATCERNPNRIIICDDIIRVAWAKICLVEKNYLPKHKKNNPAECISYKLITLKSQNSRTLILSKKNMVKVNFKKMGCISKLYTYIRQI